MVSENFSSLLLSGDQIYDSELGRPAFELSHPVRNGTFWSNDEMRLISDHLGLPEVTDESNGLDSLAKSHIVRKQPIHVVLIE